MGNELTLAIPIFGRFQLVSVEKLGRWWPKKGGHGSKMAGIALLLSFIGLEPEQNIHLRLDF